MNLKKMIIMMMKMIV